MVDSLIDADEAVASAALRELELESLLRVSQAVASTLDLDELMRLILDQLHEVVEYDCASLILLDGSELVIQDISLPHEGEFRTENRLRFVPGNDPMEWARSDARPRLDTPCLLIPASSSFWELMNRGESHLMRDALTDEDVLAASYRRLMNGRLHSAAFMRSWMATPLQGRQGTIGYFGTSSGTPGKFAARQVRMAQAFAGQAAVAIENARLYEQGKQLAVTAERHRVARDLHDSVAQAFYGVALGAKAARRYVDTDPAAAVEPLDYVISLAAAGLAEMRALIFDLHPDSIRNEGLVKAIERQLPVLAGRYGIAVAWAGAQEPEAALAVKEAVYAIMREAIHNAVKHSQAERISLRLDCEAGEVRFSVEDFGAGFEPSSVPAGHLGLTSMRERAEDLGGRLAVVSTPGGGTTVTGSIPSRL